MSGANLRNASLRRAHLYAADLSQADLAGADLCSADLRRGNLWDANLILTNLTRADCTDADISWASVYGTNAWDVKLEGTKQENLLITQTTQSPIRVDDLEIAQFIYLLLNNKKMRQAIDAITAKIVLILGRFTEERKSILDAIRQELRRRNFTPLLFDFEKPTSKDVTGTVETLARMARFIIADLTDPSSIPHELATIVPFLRITPVLPLRLAGSKGYSMFNDLQRAYTWVLDIHEYQDGASLVPALAHVIQPAETMAAKLCEAH